MTGGWGGGKLSHKKTLQVSKKHEIFTKSPQLGENNSHEEQLVSGHCFQEEDELATEEGSKTNWPSGHGRLFLK